MPATDFHFPGQTTPCKGLEGPGLTLLAAAELQDDLLAASNDLERLQRLLHDASQSLMEQFTLATAQLCSGALDQARQTIGGAVAALQFEDMAQQLIEHTGRRLRHGADRIARDTLADDEDGSALVQAPPPRPNPVTQGEMDAGSIELFQVAPDEDETPAGTAPCIRSLP